MTVMQHAMRYRLVVRITFVSLPWLSAAPRVRHALLRTDLGVLFYSNMLVGLESRHDVVWDLGAVRIVSLFVSLV